MTQTLISVTVTRLDTDLDINLLLTQVLVFKL